MPQSQAQHLPQTSFEISSPASNEKLNHKSFFSESVWSRVEDRPRGTKDLQAWLPRPKANTQLVLYLHLRPINDLPGRGKRMFTTEQKVH